jgi:hypothetical protein
MVTVAKEFKIYCFYIKIQSIHVGCLSNTNFVVLDTMDIEASFAAAHERLCDY